MTLDVKVLPDPEAAGMWAATTLGGAVERAVSEGRRFAWAISGGTSPIPMFRSLRELALPWHLIDTWQVDERVAPADHPALNRTMQERALPLEARRGIRWMPVEDEDLHAAGESYAAALPERFDVVHLGLGADGHTASLIPGDAVLDVQDRDVGVTGPYQGHRRMTLTYRGLSRGGRAVWFVTGSETRNALRQLLNGDPAIPAARVPIAESIVVTDQIP